MRLMLTCLLLAAFCLAADATPFARRTVPEGVGVSVHLPNLAPGDFALMHQAGIRLVRTDLSWARTEPRKHHYDWQAYDVFLAGLKHYGMRALLILDYGNPLYSPVVKVEGKPGMHRAAAPTGDEEVAAFSRWATAAAKHFAPHNPIWEIWNEPELNHFWPPQANVKDYLALAQQACASMRHSVPGASIVAPGAAFVPTPRHGNAAFLEEVLRAPLTTCLSGISIHPYRVPVAQVETVSDTWHSIRSSMAAAGVSPSLPLFSSEWGLSTAGGGRLGRMLRPWLFTETGQAAFLVKTMLLNAASGVQASIWYDWKDDGTDPDEHEHHFGLLRANGTHKPAYEALATLTRHLRGFHYVCQAPAGEATVLVFANADATASIAAAWADGNATWRLPQAPTAVLDMLGQHHAVPTQSLTLHHRPLYVAFAGGPDVLCGS